jgi:hypothetical protein
MCGSDTETFLSDAETFLSDAETFLNDPARERQATGCFGQSPAFRLIYMSNLLIFESMKRKKREMNVVTNQLKEMNDGNN